MLATLSIQMSSCNNFASYYVHNVSIEKRNLDISIQTENAPSSHLEPIFQALSPHESKF